MAKAKNNKSVKNKDNKKKVNIDKKNDWGDIGLFAFGLGLFCLLIIKDYLSQGNIIETTLYDIVYTVRIIFGNASFILSIILMINGYIGIKKKIKKTVISRKVAGVIAFSMYCLLLSLEELGPISTNFSEAVSDILRYAFEFKGGGLVGGLLSIPFYLYIKELWLFLIVLLLTVVFSILSLSRVIRLIYLTISKTIEYYNSDEYEKKKKLIEAKKTYELNKQKELEAQREKEFTEYFIKIKEDKLEKELYKKNESSSNEVEYYTEKELEEKKKLWQDHYNRIEELKKYEKERLDREKEEKLLRKIEKENLENSIIENETNDENIEDFHEIHEDDIQLKYRYEPEEFDLDEYTSEEYIEEKYSISDNVYISHNENSNSVNSDFNEELVEDEEKLEVENEDNYVEMYNIDTEDLNKSIEELFKYKSMDASKKEEMKKEIARNINLLEETLKNYGVNAKVTDYATGPTITRYEIKIPQDIRVKKVTDLESELKMYLRAESIRIEAPIPGKDAIGIETPNKIKEPVYFSNLIHSEELDKGILPVILGKDIVGKERIIDITKLPHLLIAGTTGSGKSIAINTMISSLISKKTDEEVKFIMVDPKMVELMPYNGIAHLLTPVITDPNMAAVALKWAVNEMEDRYKKLASLGLRNIESYNSKFSREKMPYIVIIIDELADLMMVASNNVETSIARLAQKARAIGIHLIVATQRPSTDVITGMIKANLPSRISFALRSNVDSRTILDQPGAEKLLGKGDMLFLDNGKSKLERLQGAFISDDEVTDLTDLIKSKKKVIYNDSILVEDETEDSSRDPLFEKAVEIARNEGEKDKKLSISQLQRELKVGYNRAARICDQLKQFGVINEDNEYTNSELY